MFIFLIRKFSASSVDFFKIIFLNHLFLKWIRYSKNKQQGIVEVQISYQMKKTRNVLPLKLRPVKPFWIIPTFSVFPKRLKNYASLKKISASHLLYKFYCPSFNNIFFSKSICFPKLVTYRISHKDIIFNPWSNYSPTITCLFFFFFIRKFSASSVDILQKNI